MHYSENGGVLPEWDEGGPFEHLLIMQYSSELCLVCHDNVGYPDTPDVSGEDDNGVMEERSAGYFAATGSINPNGHNLAADKAGYWEEDGICANCHSDIWNGGGADFNTIQIGCVDCHDPHGRDPGTINYRYRNLVSPWESDPDDTPKLTAFVKAGVSGLDVYEQNNIAYSTTGNGPIPTGLEWREVTYICLDCHHVFSGYGYTRTDEACIRHPNTDSVRGAQEPVSVLSASTGSHWENGVGIGFDTLDRLPFIVSGATDYTQAANDEPAAIAAAEVFCFTCHKAHGSSNASSLRWNYRDTDPGGASNIGCQQCHNKGNPPSSP